MSGSTINGKVTTTVTLGSVSYPSPLTVAITGDVTITAYTGTGVYAPAASGTLLNHGTIVGGTGAEYPGGFISAYAGPGGIGVALLSGSTATNYGTISGGRGGSGRYYGGDGGDGVQVAAGAALVNHATITGGTVGASGGKYSQLPSLSYGGAGVRVLGGSVVNDGAITGGGGYTNGRGGVGVDLLAGALTNTGIITGGAGEGSDNVAPKDTGVYFAVGATLDNSGGTIVGGYNFGLNAGGGDGIFMAAGATLTIAGVVIGGTGGSAAPYGGNGVYLAGSGSLTNTGFLTGGGGVFNDGSGVDLAHGGTLINVGTIAGSSIANPLNSSVPGVGASLANGGVVINDGLITGGTAGSGDLSAPGGDGVDLVHGGMVTNSADATIAGGSAYYGHGGTGVRLTGGTLTNAGTIAGGDGAGSFPGSYPGGIGVSLAAGAILTNSGSISGGGVVTESRRSDNGGTGVVMGAGTLASTATNSGVITGGNAVNVPAGGAVSRYALYLFVGGNGVSLASGSTLINSGLVAGGDGAYVAAGGRFTNYGTVFGGTAAVVVAGGTLINAGVMRGGDGVYLAAGGTLTNAGTIGGGVYGGVTADAVLFAGAGRLVVDPGASFAGDVAGNASSTDLLDLVAGSSPGTLSGIGTQFTNFSQITIGRFASWELTGANTIAAGTTLTELGGASLDVTGTLVNNGSIVLDPSRMTVAGLTGTGLVTIEAGSTLDVLGSIASSETIVFGGSGAYLHLGAPDNVAGGITNFDFGETIDLQGIDPASVSYASGQLLFDGGDFPLAFANGDTVAATASADGAEVTALCFCTNTLILTPFGERSVQDLVRGDLVTTHRGVTRPIVWIGTGKVLATRGRRSAATPVIVRKGALGDNVPNQDLRVTKGHAFWLDGALIPVEFLVNHRSIEWDDRAQEVELFHVELASHDVLVANGAAAESYRDDGNRWLFLNANSGWGEPPKPPCAPVLTGGPIVDAIWRRLLERSGPRPGFVMTGESDLHLLVDGVRLDAGGWQGGAYVFHLPARPSSVRIVSRAGAPAETGLARDPRVLGVAVQRIALRQGARFHVIGAAHALLSEGFYPFEEADGLRWTDGDAALPAALVPGSDGPMDLLLYLGGATRYPLLGTTDWRFAA